MHEFENFVHVILNTRDHKDSYNIFRFFVSHHNKKDKNVMKLIDVFYNKEKGKIYMVLEYCCAVLKDMLDQSEGHKYPVWQSQDYFFQLITGLDYLHIKGIVHQDIKSGKIADFGVCERLDTFAPDDLITTTQRKSFFGPLFFINLGKKSKRR